MHQTKYISDLLAKAKMNEAKPCLTPCSTTLALDSYSGQPLSQDQATIFRSLVGSLQYLSWTRPDLSFSVNQVCQYLHSPRTTHFQSLKRILRFLKGTPSHGILISKGPSTLTAYCDADWAGSHEDRRSTSEYSLFLGSTPLSWSAKKQPIVARSSTEAEYRALAITAAKITWMCKLLKDLHIPLYQCPTIWDDNQSAMAIAMNPIFHARTKHIEVDYHYVRELIQRKLLRLQYIHTTDQLADIFTKGLSTVRFQTMQSKLQVRPLSLEGV